MNPTNADTTAAGNDRATGPRGRRAPRLRTLVFGLLLALVSVSVTVSETAGNRVDGAVLVIAALIGSGVILLVGAVGAAARGDGRPTTPPTEATGVQATGVQATDTQAAGPPEAG